MWRYRREQSKRKPMWVSLLTAYWIWMALSQALAQPSSDYRAVYIDNGVLRLGLGLAGQYNLNNTNYEAIGRVSLGTSGGTRFSSEDDNLPLTGLHPFPCGPFGTVFVRIVNADGGVEDVVWGSGGSWVLTEPLPDPARRYRLVGRWQTSGGIVVEQAIELVGGYARIRWTITNNTTQAQQVGIALLLDEEVGRGLPAGGSYILVPGYFPLQNELSLEGGQVPAFIDAAPRRDVQTPVLRWLLRQSGLTPPQRVAIGELARLAAAPWTFVPLPGLVVQDFAVATYWNPERILPGGSRTIVTMVGLATSSNDPTGRFALDVETPSVLELRSSAANQLAPEEFVVTATVTNYVSGNPIQDIPLDGVSLSISLPVGLQLAAGESVTKQIGTLQPGQVGAVSWRVQPTGQRVGDLTLRVSASASPGGLSKSVSRSLLAPALPRVTLRPTYQMVSFPYQFRSASPEDVLGLSAQQFVLLRWDSERRRYALVDTIRPGEGYWLRGVNEATLPLNGAILSVDAFSGVLRAALPQGWVQIGNPFPYPVAIGLIRFVDTRTGFAASFTDAVRQGWVRNVLFYYEPTPPAGYRTLSLFADPSAPLLPGLGYWMYVDRSGLEILYPNVVTIGANVQYPSRSAAAEVRWQVQLSVQDSNSQDSATVIGAASRAVDGFDIYDVPKPPAPVEGGVQAAIVSVDGSSLLAQDIRAEGVRRQVWDVLVTSQQSNTPVTVRWTGMQTVPSALRLRLVDPEAKVTRDMRTASAYTFTIGSTGSRRLQIVAEPRGNAGLRITALRVTPSRGGGVAISYAVSEDATTRVRILNAGGQVVQALRAGDAVSRGVNTLVWNGRDSAGIAVPAGTYLVEVVATSEDGQTARAVQPIVITR